MKAVHFGAGNIGRGFIGVLLHRSGFRVVFVDVNDTIVEALQDRGRYPVQLAGEEAPVAWVDNVTAIHGTDTEAVAEAIASADLVTTAIGVKALPHIAPALAAGIRRRLEAGGAPLHIVACENTIGGSSRLRDHVFRLLNEAEVRQAAGRIAFPDSAVDRIVPQQQHEDPLKVTVEPYYEWVLDRSAMLDGFPAIAGATVVPSLEPYLLRKLFTVNTGHASAAYFGYLQGHATIQQVMGDEGLRAKVMDVMAETGRVLCRMFGFAESEHGAYIETIAGRFANPGLTDSVLRVGRSPLRKLSPDDRFMRPAMLASEMGIATPRLLEAIAAGLRFDSPGDEEAVFLQQKIRTDGIERVVTDVLGVAPAHPLHGAIVEQYARMGGDPS